MVFYLRYGFITDDHGYFIGGQKFTKTNIFRLDNGTEFIYFITHFFFKHFHFNLLSFHILFATLGLVGSLNFLYIYFSRIENDNKKLNKILKTAFWTITCFPNFLAWGRFFGKDSLTFFLSSMLAVFIWKIVSNSRVHIIHWLFLLFFPLWAIGMIRAHIAIALGGSSLFIISLSYMGGKKDRDIHLHSLLRVYIPLLMIVFVAVFGNSMIKRLTGNSSVSSADMVENSLIQATSMGAWGGSKTELASDINENSRIIFSPFQIAKNIFLLLFAPLPWQVRNIIDIMAVMTNILLFYLIYKFAFSLSLNDLYQKYLLLCVFLLTIVLSFMTGNVGLILRQKTIILPFLFLLIFSVKSSRQKLPHYR